MSGIGQLFPAGWALVVGGSGGIGLAICERLAKNGVDVALTFRSNRAAADAAVAAVERAGARAIAGQVALDDRGRIAGFCAEASASFGRLHSVVYAVGADISMSHVSEVSSAEWRSTIDGDLNGFFEVVQATLPILKEGGGGSVTALSSAGILRHPPRDILSTAPKAAIEALVRGIAREEGRFGIRANAVALGVIDAGLFHRLEERLPDKFVDAMRANVPLRRFGTAAEAADATVFLASSQAGFITGHSLVVDGGYSV